MTREEIANLLEVLIGAYPNTNIKDAEATLNTWEMELGSYSAESVYKSARLHIHNSKFFPTPSEIIRGLLLAEMVYKESPIEINKLDVGDSKRLTDGTQSVTEGKQKEYKFFQVDGSVLTFKTEEELDEWLDNLIKSEMERDDI